MRLPAAQPGNPAVSLQQRPKPQKSKLPPPSKVRHAQCEWEDWHTCFCSSFSKVSFWRWTVNDASIWSQIWTRLNYHYIFSSFIFYVNAIIRSWKAAGFPLGPVKMEFFHPTPLGNGLLFRTSLCNTGILLWKLRISPHQRTRNKRGLENLGKTTALSSYSDVCTHFICIKPPHQQSPLHK